MASGFNQVPAKADGQGVIEIKGLPQERHYSLNVTAKGYGSTNLQAQIGDTKTNRCEFPAVVLKAADQKLAGQVLGPDSKPVSGATVILQGDGQPGGNTRTDAQGHFILDAVLEGAVRLFANGQDAGGNYMNGSVQAQGGDTNVVIRFGIDGVNNRPNARVMTTSGTVLDPAGAPVAGVRLSILGAYGGNIEVTSETNGKYSITWQKQNFAGQTAFILCRDLERHLAACRDLDDTATNLDLRLQPALTLSVKVQDTNGKPIAAATDNLLVYSGNAGFVISQSSSSANAGGVIEFNGLPQERHYSAHITARGFGTATVQAQIGDTKTNHFDFPTTVLKAADRKLAGQVLGPDSKPVPGANVNMQGEGQPFGNTTTDAQGHFTFDAACEGPVRLSANSQGVGGNYMNGSAQAQGGDTNVVIRFGINAQGGAANARVVTTSGRVFDPAGACRSCRVPA
jgi:protocatechuate 3,4-dioxygenase beta subunit